MTTWLTWDQNQQQQRKASSAKEWSGPESRFDNGATTTIPIHEEGGSVNLVRLVLSLLQGIEFHEDDHLFF